MDFLTKHLPGRAEALVSQIRQESDLTSPRAKKAFRQLHDLGDRAVPQILEAFASADKSQTVEFVEVLSKLVTDQTLPVIVRGLADPNKRTVSGTAWTLSTSRSYNINNLVDMLGDEDFSRSAIIDILTVHKDRLNVRRLLDQAYLLPPREKVAIFKLIGDIMTEELVPELLSRMDGKDPAVKRHLIGVLARFDRPEVRSGLEEQLKDGNKLVRQAALTGLASMKNAVNLDLISSLLLDSDMDVINTAADVIVKLNDPETIKYLMPALMAESEFSRRAAVEVLNEIGTTDSVKHLFESLADKDWWVRTRATDALARIGGERVMLSVLELIKDKDENIRRAAIEILNICGDKRAIAHLIEATKDKDWWVCERAADALAGIGDATAIPALLNMLERNDKSLPTALMALGKLGDHKQLQKLVPYLGRKEKEVKVAAIEAVTQLAGEQYADVIGEQIRKSLTTNDETVAKVAAKAIQKLQGRAATGQFNATGKMNAPQTGTPNKGGSTAAAVTLLVEGTDIAAVTSKLPATVFDVSKLKEGDLIENRYKYIKKIGKGAFGTVVLVDDTIVDEELILKFLNPNIASDEEMMKRFVQELRYSRRITHKNVIRIYDFLYISGGYAISMEYFPSHTLGAEIAKEKPMPANKAVSFAIDICIGMQIAHQQGIVHRDLKPANILINDSGLLKIVDFGVAAAVKSGDTQLTKTGYVIGSPKYMAPEQILGKTIDERADIYSLGVMLYEMLAGTPPYHTGDHMAVMYQHVQGKASPLMEANPDVSPELSEIVGKSMMLDKSKRYTSMAGLYDSLEAVAEKLA